MNAGVPKPIRIVMPAGIVSSRALAFRHEMLILRRLPLKQVGRLHSHRERASIYRITLWVELLCAIGLDIARESCAML